MRVRVTLLGGWLVLAGCAQTTRITVADGSTADVATDLAVPPIDAGTDVATASDTGADVSVMDAVGDSPMVTDAGADADDGSSMTVPRPIAPLSTATVTSQRPTLHWVLATGGDGAHLEICLDRGCTMIEQTLDVSTTQVRVPSALTPGVHYWRLASRSGGVIAMTWSPTWEFVVGHRSAPLDTSWGTLADFNGDGLPDVVVGATNAVFVYFGVTGGLSTMPTAVAVPSGAQEFGAAVASAGDVNGDGYADLAVGDQGTGTVYVYLGGASDLGQLPITLAGPDPTAAFGGTVAGAGDVNGDGYADLLVGTENVSNAYVYLGSASGPTGVPIVLTNGDTRVGTSFTVAPAGDVNGDGYADIVAGAWFLGDAYLFIGTPTGTSTMPFTLTQPASAHGFGVAVSGAEDVNGDGYADIVATAANALWLYTGGIEGPSMTPVSVAGAEDLAEAGSPIAGAGDVNGDGYGDYIVGDSSASAAYVFQGGAMGLGTPTNVRGTTGSLFGIGVSGAGDVNGDGYGDALVGSSAGAYLILGRASGIDAPTTPTLTRSSAEGFGTAVAMGAGREGTLRCRSIPLWASRGACGSPLALPAAVAPRPRARRSG